MHCVRRAALRTACASSRFAAVPRQQVAANLVQISKANVRPTAVLPLSRYFSQTAPVAEEEKDIVDNAINAAGPGNAASSAAEDDPESNTVFISNMTFDATDVHLEEAFGKYGEITRVNIGRDGRGLSRGFGFVRFTTQEAADRAVAEASNSFWHGRRIRVEHRKPAGESSAGGRAGRTGPTNSLYIGNIPYEASDADLNAMFRKLDNVRDVRVAVDRNTGWPRGFAHADFHDVESAKKAYEFLSTETLSGRQLRIDFSSPRKAPYQKNDRNDRD
ncbi:RNA-binding domain-containing protein [Astrocystis sublimbata]|nr:RNA-binding domain-containing protein [Astrocystis sublimbata]